MALSTESITSIIVSGSGSHEEEMKELHATDDFMEGELLVAASTIWGNHCRDSQAQTQLGAREEVGSN